MCVQNFDDSRGPAFRITYRISLRSSSLWKPRHPLLKVVCYLYIYCIVTTLQLNDYVISYEWSSFTSLISDYHV